MGIVVEVKYRGKELDYHSREENIEGRRNSKTTKEDLGQRNRVRRMRKGEEQRKRAEIVFIG